MRSQHWVIVSALLVAWGCDDASRPVAPDLGRLSTALDPQPSAADWTASGETKDTHLGIGLGVADVNGDGFSDIIAGSYLGPRVFLGGGSGPTPAAAAPALGSTGYYAIAGAGDVNGDGFDDVIFGDETYMDSSVGGSVGVYLGSATGLQSDAAWNATIDTQVAKFGCSVDGAGDVNGDGYDDVIVGAYAYDDGQDVSGTGEDVEGAAFVYLGSSTGLSNTPAWRAEGNALHALFGFSVAGAGDVNGDGFDDVIVGAYDYPLAFGYGRVFVYLGSSSGLSATPAWFMDAPMSSEGGDMFGAAVSGAGDVNGDGYADVIVGARWFSNTIEWVGRAYVYLGGPNGPASSPVWIGEGSNVHANFGLAVAGAGDVNGDGFGDIVVGGYSIDDVAGRVALYLGQPEGVSAVAAWTSDAASGDENFGSYVAGAADVDGNGFDDVIFSSSLGDGMQNNPGRVRVHFGSGPSCAGRKAVPCAAAAACQTAPVCDQQAGCVYALRSAGTSCRAASCVDGAAQPSAACDGNHSDCPAMPPVACETYACVDASCLAHCSADSECAATAYCSAGSCEVKKSQSGACDADHACASGACVDGHCCDTRCAGSCEACDVSGHEGACTPLTGTPHGDRARCSGNTSCTAGVCDPRMDAHDAGATRPDAGGSSDDAGAEHDADAGSSHDGSAQRDASTGRDDGGAADHMSSDGHDGCTCSMPGRAAAKGNRYLPAALWLLLWVSRRRRRTPSQTRRGPVLGSLRP